MAYMRQNSQMLSFHRRSLSYWCGQMKNKTLVNKLSRRERQIMDIVYKLGEATANDVMKRMPDAPGNPTVRKQLCRLEEKGLLKHYREGKQFVYRPTIPKDQAQAGALNHLVETFFSGSATRAVVALLDSSQAKLSEDDKKVIMKLIEAFKKEGR